MIDVVVVIDEITKNKYYLSPNFLDLKKNNKVIFTTSSGNLLLGKVSKSVYKEHSNNLLLPLSQVLRIANEEDIRIYSENIEVASEALLFAKKLNKDMELDMHFVDSYFTFDRSQLLFSFMADNRIDFRELAKKLASRYKTRIELRQVGVRDKAKKIGGLGPCGLFLCCNSFLNDFYSVSINMAKNQMIALNPVKINGICGRLMCCLGFENEVYSDLKKGLPKIGLIADTPMGMGKVVSVDILKGLFYVDLKENGIVSFSKDDV